MKALQIIAIVLFIVCAGWWLSAQVRTGLAVETAKDAYDRGYADGATAFETASDHIIDDDWTYIDALEEAALEIIDESESIHVVVE